MFKNVQVYLYTGIALCMIALFSYIAYVFHDRAEAKKTILQKDTVIKTQKVETKLTSIAEKAKGKIEQIEKEEPHEADTSFGVHSYTF